jgi:hypothetical protein
VRTIHPLYAFLGALVCVLAAVLIAPLFPHPAGTLLYWVGLIAALVLVVVGTAGLVGRSR